MVVVMLSGVAFFSYIMSNFIEIIAEYNAKMGPVDKTDTLDNWMIELQRFNNKTPLNASLVEEIYNNQNYFWSNDKLVALNEEDDEFRAIPEDIKIQIVCNYLFKDLFGNFTFFLQPEIKADQKFLFALSRGLMPRRFDANDQNDKIIYEENQEVAELYFVMKGFIGYAVN